MVHSKANEPGSPQTDEELVRLAQTGNAPAQRHLMERFRPLVQTLAAPYTGAAFDREDLVQEGLVALFSAVYAYQPEKAASFRTFASVCIANRLRSAARESAAQKNAPMHAYVPLDTLEIAEDSDPVHQVISDETVDEWFRIFEQDLSALENKVLRCCLNGYSYQEIAEMLQITEKAADNALQRIRKKLKARKTTE